MFPGVPLPLSERDILLAQAGIFRPVNLMTAMVGAATLAIGALVYGQGTDQFATLSPGASGRVLQAQGAGAAPTWFDLFGTANIWTAAQTFKPSITVGDGTVKSTVEVLGLASGTSGGAYLGVKNSGSTIVYIGNWSALNGGSFDATPTLLFSGGLRLAESGTVRATIDSAGNFGIGAIPTAGNGLLQFASGTTKANGIAYGTDLGAYRNASGSLRIENLTGNTTILSIHGINNVYAELNFLTNDASPNSTSIFGSSYGLEIISASGNSGLRVGFTTNENNPYKLWVNGSSRFDGNVGFNSTAPIAKPTAAAAATDAATTQTLANSLRTILINYGLAA
jgi:hypothetical protein